MRLSLLLVCLLLVVPVNACAGQYSNAGQEKITTLEEYRESLDYSCVTNDDCTVKDVHNCCGFYPGCVNKNARTNSELVKKLCRENSIASVCGFPSITSCQCVKGRCEPVKQMAE
jgi:hypothetical protein